MSASIEDLDLARCHMVWCCIVKLRDALGTLFVEH